MRTEPAPWFRIAEILMREWDPIGIADTGGPSDEYDHYAANIASLLKDGADAHRIAAYLQTIEREWMGLEHIPPERSLRAAREIVSLEGPGDR